jgi:hypothetical protein
VPSRSTRACLAATDAHACVGQTAQTVRGYAAKGRAWRAGVGCKLRVARRTLHVALLGLAAAPRAVPGKRCAPTWALSRLGPLPLRPTPT